VFDGIDRCPNTPPNVKVDSLGCRVLEKGQSITVRVQFESCKWDIDAKGETDLKEALEVLLAYPELSVVIEGHTDNQNPTGACATAVGDNKGLSRFRAQAVYDWLVAKGVAPSQLKVEPFGAAKPVADNNTADGRALNRRIEFRRIK
jgi:OOP family OmpA-OmpF porin